MENHIFGIQLQVQSLLGECQERSRLGPDQTGGATASLNSVLSQADGEYVGRSVLGLYGSVLDTPGVEDPRHGAG